MNYLRLEFLAEMVFKSCNQLQRTVEKWLRLEIEERRKIRKERLAKGSSEFVDQNLDGTRVTGQSAKPPLNNGWASGRLQSTLAGEEIFDMSSSRVLRG